MSDDHPAELPPEPTEREITPAPEDFANPPALANLVWPAFWIVVIGVLASVCYCVGWIEPAAH